MVFALPGHADVLAVGLLFYPVAMNVVFTK